MGMAVDGNILIPFERMKEELERGLSVEDAVKEGFARAWFSFNPNSNTSSIITGLILFHCKYHHFIKGFHWYLFLGVVVSMFTAITVSRTLLMSLGGKEV